eukprot:9072103-Pyramimonas_sp.AAC.1
MATPFTSSLSEAVQLRLARGARGKPASLKSEEDDQQEADEEEDDEMAEVVDPAEEALEGYASDDSIIADVAYETDAPYRS